MAVNRQWRRHITQPHILRCGAWIDLQMAEFRMAAKRLQFRSESKRAATDADIKRLLSQAIARKGQLPLLSVVDSQREHTVGPPERPRKTEMLDRLEKNLRVGRSPEIHTERGQFVSYGLKIVNFAIENDDMATGRRFHRLRTGLR